MSDYGRIRRGPMGGDRFAQVANAALRDRRISFKARGVLALLASHQDGFRISVKAIAQLSDCDGVYAVNKALEELEAHGYLVREQSKGADGRFGVTDFYITDEPHLYGPGGLGHDTAQQAELPGLSPGPSLEPQPQPQRVAAAAEAPAAQPAPGNPKTGPTSGNTKTGPSRDTAAQKTGPTSGNTKTRPNGEVQTRRSTPQCSYPQTENPCTENPCTGNCIPKNTSTKNTKIENTSGGSSPPPPPAPAPELAPAQPAAATAPGREGGGGFAPGVRQVLDALPPPWRLGKRAARTAAPGIAQALAEGWSPGDLVEWLLSGGTAGVRVPQATLMYRLGDRPDPPVKTRHSATQRRTACPQHPTLALGERESCPLCYRGAAEPGDAAPAPPPPRDGAEPGPDPAARLVGMLAEEGWTLDNRAVWAKVTAEATRALAGGSPPEEILAAAGAPPPDGDPGNLLARLRQHAASPATAGSRA